MVTARLLEVDALPAAGGGTVLLDCRFSLADPGAGRAGYLAGHIPGAHFLDLNRDLSGPPARHGGRHPLPAPATFAATLARFGVGLDTPVIAYDDSRLAGAARLWWLMRSLGYRPPVLLNGGYAAFLAAGGQPETTTPTPRPSVAPGIGAYRGACAIDEVRAAGERGILLVDAREERRYLGLEEPIDPVAGHIPGAINRPWQGITTEQGRVRETEELRGHWGDALKARELVVYCGSGVTACVNLFSLSLLGREDARLYAGSWGDWCSYL